MSSSSTILVTGDFVRDVHLYIKSAGESAPAGPQATVHAEALGGAALTHRLLTRARALAKERQDAANADRRAKNQPEEPDKPLPDICLGVETDANGLPVPFDSLTSYGVWTPHPTAPKLKDMVWRVSMSGGYGTAASPAKPMPMPRPAAVQATTVVLDDGALGFRYAADSNQWPDLGSARQILLKHSAPLCRGDLWAALTRTAADRLTVIVKASDLRRDEAQVSRRLSWEQTVVDTLRVLESHAILRDLKRASTLVVTFGDAGALCVRRVGAKVRRIVLLFRPGEMEGQHASRDAGSVYGFQSCMAAALAYRIAALDLPVDEGKQPPVLDDLLLRGIRSGLRAQRTLYEAGHGRVAANAPGFPDGEIAQAILASAGEFEAVDVPLHLAADPASADAWSILHQLEPGPSGNPAPMAGLARLVARFGRNAVATVPHLAIGPLFSVDRREIESLRAVERSIADYEAAGRQKKPLSVAVFGPPGAGKSFAVKAIAQKLLPNSQLLEFNLSQFQDARDLVGAFHQVRDEVLQGHTPVVFWDEFDSKDNQWLQYLLAPMQDGRFQEDHITHPLGKCVFVFAGGTSATLEGFTPSKDNKEAHALFRQRKGPDFVSRLHAYLDVMGPNPPLDANHQPTGGDRTYPIRRALVLRALLGAFGDEVLNLDTGLLHALLTVPRYIHGTRSFEKIVQAVRSHGGHHISRSALPSMPMLNRDTDGPELLRLMATRDAFKTDIDIEALAKLFHDNYLAEAAKNKWQVNERFDKPYEKLDADAQAANRGSALRVPELLELIDFGVEGDKNPMDDSWQVPVKAAIDHHIDRLAQAEHLGWMEERIANGWRYGVKRDDQQLRHTALVPWNDLSADDQEKDRANVRLIPKVLDMARYKAVAR